MLQIRILPVIAVVVCSLFGVAVRAEQPNLTTDGLLEHYRELAAKAENGSPTDKTRFVQALRQNLVPNAHTNAKLIALLHAASRDGDTTADQILSDHYRQGLWVGKDGETADQYRHRAVAAKRRNSEALRIVEVDCAELATPAFEQILQTALSATDAYKVAWCRLTNTSNPPEQSTVDLLAKAAQMGLDLAQIALANLYEQGLGVDKSPALAAQWYGRASLSSSTPSLRDEASYRSILLGLAKNSTADWASVTAELLRLATVGHPNAELLVAQLAFANDLPALKAERTLARAESVRKAGYGIGHLLVGVCHEHGYGTPIDLTKAVASYEIAAVSGYAIAYARLADLRSSGVLGQIDLPQAITEYRKAIELGYGPAEKNLRFLESRTAPAAKPQ